MIFCTSMWTRPLLPSTKWLLRVTGVGFALAISVVVASAFHVDFDSFLPHRVYLTLHIVGAVIFVGNIIVTGTWMFWAERTRQREVIAFATHSVHWADVFFTAPGVTLVFANGFIMAQDFGGIQTSWITVALSLFTLSGVVWVLTLIPAQDRLARLSSIGTELPADFYHALHRWYFWGIVATLLPLGSLVIMVTKPHFW